MMPGEIDSSRRLALRLHALHESDRDWILSQIDGEARARLESMLQELDSLGFRIDQEILDSVVGHADAPELPAVDYRQHVELLRGAQTEWLLKQLKGEPQALIDCLATTYPWSWLAELRASDVLDRQPVRRDEPYLGQTPRVRQALLAELARRMKDDQPTLDRPRPASNGPRRTGDDDASRPTLGLWRWWPWKR